MKVKDLMTTDVKSCREYCTLNSAAQTMWENDIGCVPIVDHENRVIGMLTDRDVCMGAYIQGLSLTAASVTSAMSKQVFSCHPQDDLASVERLMREKQIHRVPVVDAEGRLAGIVSLNDIAREAAQESRAKKSREVSDAEVTGTMASVCAPRHRVITATQAAA
jgi:CBS-domain-containing membrane protein